MKVVYVVLHYITEVDTKNCVYSILDGQKTEEHAIDIVIVDNGSPNKSYQSLYSTFSQYKNVHLIQSKDNLGFAQGNNFGFKFARDVLNADFIALINNDTLIKDQQFTDLIIQRYLNQRFDILAPDIVNLSGQHQNPKALSGYTYDQLSRKIKRVKRDLLLTKTGIYQLLIMADHLKRRIRNPVNRYFEANHKNNYQIPQSNIVPHGSCLIFSPDYIKRFNGLFSQTFLYCEEEIIWQIAQVENITIEYDPKLVISHLEDRSTNAIHQTPRKKRLFKLKHELDSLKKLKQITDSPAVYRDDLKIMVSGETDVLR